MKRHIKVILLLTIFVLSVPTEAKAYLDPGTGSYVFQIVVAGLLGGVYAIKASWGKITGIFKKNDKHKEPVKTSKG